MESNQKGWRHNLSYAAKTYREGWKLAPGLLVFHLCSMLLFDVVLVYIVMYINRAIVAAVTERNNVSLAIGCIIGLFAVALTTKLLDVISKVISTKISLSFRLNDENRIIEKVERVKYELLERPSYYDTFSMVSANVSDSVLQFVRDVHTVLIGIVNAVVSIGILISYRAWLGIALSLLEVLFVILNLKYYDYQMKFRRKDAPKRRRINELKGLLFKKESVIDVKLNGSEDFILDKLNENYGELYKSLCKKNKAKIFADSLADIYHNVKDFAIMLVYLLRVFSGAITIADYTLMINLIGKASKVVGTPVDYFGIIVDDLQYLSDYYDFVNLEDERTGKANVSVSGDSTTPCEIELDNFSFSYPESDNLVLDSINLKINPGEVVAIVGENGAGKTTLVKNILGLYETYGGKISMGGVDYRDCAARDIYDRFSVVMQDYMKYPFTLRDNITISDSGSKLNAADAALDELMAGVDGSSIVENAGQGYDTYLSKEMDENGTDLSEGQWQKVMLARALYRNRGMVIFDEPTASLDPIAEETFYRNVIDNANGKTVIVVTHRLACTAAADKIIVMQKGKIIETGTHSELMKMNGMYARMYHMQADGYSAGKQAEADTEAEEVNSRA